MKRLVQLRKQKGWSQQKLAEKIKRTRSALAMWETGGVQPDNSTLVDLANILDTSIDYLLERTDYSDSTNENICNNISVILENTMSENKNTFIPHDVITSIKDGVYKFTYDTLNQIAKFLNVTPESLMQNSESQNQTIGIRIPVLGTVRAGIPIDAIEEILDYEEITPQMASSGDYFALKIKGNSMEPKFSEGDVVIVRKQNDVDTGDIAIVLINGDEATVKKIKKQEDGISLIPSNPAYDIKFFNQKEIETLPVNIIGKVVELRAKF